MPKETHSFKRLVLGLQPSEPGRTVRFGVELANLLHVELLGLFLEDAGLRQLASIPVARELRPLGGGWQPIELDRLSRELELVARRTERLFVDAAKLLTARSQFEVVRGPAAETIASISRADDIFMISEPSSTADRVTYQFSSLVQAAVQSIASVVFVPPHPVRSAGAVLAIAVTPDDPSINTAAAIAAAAKEELIIVEVGKHVTLEQDIRKLAADEGLRINRTIVDARALADPVALTHALHNMRERLTVVTRGVLTDDVARSIASSRRLPVLMVEPAKVPRAAPVPEAQ